MKIIPVDCNYVEAGFAASYLLVKNGRGFFIECNTNHAIPFLREAAEREGISPPQVDGLLITHVHLDHAGGAGFFLETFPNAKLYAHPRAARHAIDPAKLIASATAVYGQAFMDRLYGTILPCEKDRVIEVSDGESVSFQGEVLNIKHTRGHANHHLVAFEPRSRTLFTGDSCGVSYPRINQKHGIVILASTSPTDFDGAAALATLDWIEALAPARIAPTHFGFIEKRDFERVFPALRRQLGFSIELVKRIRQEMLTEEQVTGALREWAMADFSTQGIQLDLDDLALLEIDFKVNAQGLVFAASSLK